MSKDLSAAAITKGLKTRKIGRKVFYLPRVTSTMDIARSEAIKGAAEGTVVIAGEQTGGRGRLKRSWLAPEGNIALSIILYPDIESLPYLIMIASLAVVKIIESVTGLKAGIKWPNDILINGKKVCGVLIENEVRGNKVTYSIVGIGINVDLKVADHAEIATTATSLKDESGKDDLRIKIIRSLLTEFERLYLKLPDGKAIYEAWRNNLITLGKNVRVESGNQTIEGVAEAADEDGALVIHGADGTVTKVVAGDVTLREK
ncbi:MAG: biotin--[acetyl-CoA-carboxylase] ligase [Chloroflexi bacterium RBG_13_51_52]|nr:MAG: biotin--[acetyl-CoA-carboxylase] ligase [Chloroflexi bacterium RBG_13_51_52]